MPSESFSSQDMQIVSEKSNPNISTESKKGTFEIMNRFEQCQMIVKRATEIEYQQAPPDCANGTDAIKMSTIEIKSKVNQMTLS